MDVLIFKTSVTRQSQASKVYALLAGFANIHQVSLDLDDCDRVLRVVGNNPSANLIKTTINSLGFLCAELDD